MLRIRIQKSNKAYLIHEVDSLWIVDILGYSIYFHWVRKRPDA